MHEGCGEARCSAAGGRTPSLALSYYAVSDKDLKTSGAVTVRRVAIV